jgi:SAM-dependent methyltransferase
MKLADSSQRSAIPPVMDYEGSGYRADFWDGQGRDYEDAAERLAVQQILPCAGKRLVEIGAGFGRLGDLYLGYERVVLFDYSRTLLGEAHQRWGHDPRFVFVAGNLYDLALASHTFDDVVMIRVMHHLADVPRALAQIRRVMRDEGVAVLEYANKRNLKSIGRWLLGQQSWSPWNPAPVEFVRLNYDFHPAWMWEQFQRARLTVRRQFAVSHFRLALFKQNVPTEWLARADSWLFRLGGRYPLSPSVFVQLTAMDLAEADTSAGRNPEDSLDSAEYLFSCPACWSERTLVHADDDLLECTVCTNRYARQEGIWDFKEPVD